MTGSRPTIAFLMPAQRRDVVFPLEARERLAALGDVVIAGDEATAIAGRLPEVLPHADACLTGWGSPAISPEMLAKAPRLRIIAHSAGSIRHIIPFAAFERGIVVCHAARVIGETVAESTVLSILMGLRRPHLFDRAMKAAVSWEEAGRAHDEHALDGKTVGLVGCGYVARHVISLLKPFRVRFLVYDPYLATERAAQLGVELTSLDGVMSGSDILSVHAPITPETRHMIGAEQLARLRDGAIFVNTARAWSVDQAALLTELQTGRFWAALDIFEPEPLPLDSPFRKLENVLLTPHRAGYAAETIAKQGTAMVGELARFFAGQPLEYQVAKESYAMMA